MESFAFPAEGNGSMTKGSFDEFADRMGFSGRDDIVVCLLLLEHHPHCLDIIPCIAPVALCVEVAKVDFVCSACEYSCDAGGDLAGDECLGASGRFVVEEDAVACEDVIAFAIGAGNPVGVEFCNAVGADRMEGCCFVLWFLYCCAVDFAGGCLVEFGVDPRVAYGFEEA